MKWLSFLALWLAFQLPTIADGPDEQYVQLYNLIQQADILAQNNNPRGAADAYTEARKGLMQLQSSYPKWNENVLKFRLEYVGEKIAGLEKALPPATRTGPAVSTGVKKETGSAGTGVEVASLNEEVRRLSAEKESLEGKLREALAVQPSAMNPRELAKAQEQLVVLQKERDLLKVSLEQEQANAAAAKKAQEITPSDARKVKQLEKERDELQKKLAATSREISSSHAEQDKLLQAQALQIKATQEQRDELGRKLKAITEQQSRATETANADQTTKLKQLEKERDDLKKNLTSALTEVAGQAEQRNSKEQQLRALEEKARQSEQERADLKRQLQELSAKASRPAEVKVDEAGAKRMKQMEQQRDEAQKSLTMALADLATARASREDGGKIKRLESERESLSRQLAAAEKKLQEKSAEKTSGSSSSRKEVDRLRARLAVMESRPSPFTPEELASFQKPVAGAVAADAPARASSAPLTPVPVASETKAAKKGNRELPPGAGALVAEADRAFEARRYDEAEKKYLQVLAQDDKNLYALSHLGAVNLEMSRLGEAEKYLKRSLESDGEDEFSLSLMGVVKYDQDKYDEAIDYLSRAAKINPKRSATQVFIGLALAKKGQRGPAEAALRKALELQPNNPDAHYNLALIYASQNPPFLEMARWHYQKALVFGAAKNPTLELKFSK